MKIINLNTNDIRGGAARAAYRIHKGLLNKNIDSEMLVQQKDSDDITVKKINSNFLNIPALSTVRMNRLPLKILKTNEKELWSLNYLPTTVNKKIKNINPDIVHLHWIGSGFISIKDLGKIRKPIVWTIHDMWAFTGGFHYSQKYIDHDKSFLSKQIWQRKNKYWKNLNLTIVSPSNWLANQAKKSKLLKNKTITVIPNGLNTKVFKPINKEVAKNILNLPPNKKYILFGATNATSDKRKGYEYMKKALNIYKQKYKKNNEIEALVFGASRPKNEEDIAIKINYLGKISDDTTLALIYSASELVIIPSLQDNLPNIVMEALSCGTPCVAFNVGGIPDMINHKENGYLANPYLSEELAEGIDWILKDEDEREKISLKARKKVLDNYTLEKVASQYVQLYKNILSTNK
ncbi:MAG: glycosyltransferase family 4 protein [Candidatus Pacebacteria bacterium]|nr:glycosyltransferase family 4 protein [Candidatus Paceibacterota bacterium]